MPTIFDNVNGDVVDVENVEAPYNFVEWFTTVNVVPLNEPVNAYTLFCVESMFTVSSEQEILP
jgi:hypothetical protein